MVNNIELRREYVKLVQQGKTDAAFEKLQEIWRVEGNLKKEVKVIKPIVKEKVVVKKFGKMEDLSKIKGIGKETVKDISSLYVSIEDLVADLRLGKNLPLRNDVEKKLKKELL